MKPINIKNTEKLTAAIAEAQGKATARTITADGICKKLAAIEEYIGIAKKNLVGTVVWCDINAQSFPSAYKYKPESTLFKAEYRASGWFVTSINRCGTWQSDTKTTEITLSETAKKAVIERMSRF